MSKIFKNEDYKIKRENRCVVCGCRDDNKLTRHHIIPSCYISKKSSELIQLLKSKTDKYSFEYDYCCVCKGHHREYEQKYARQLHGEIWKFYNVDLKETSHKQPFKGLPKPSEIVMNQIVTVEDYLNLRDFCIYFFKEKMKPKYPLL